MQVPTIFVHEINCAPNQMRTIAIPHRGVVRHDTFTSWRVNEKVLEMQLRKCGIQRMLFRTDFVRRTLCLTFDKRWHIQRHDTACQTCTFEGNGTPLVCPRTVVIASYDRSHTVYGGDTIVYCTLARLSVAVGDVETLYHH